MSVKSRDCVRRRLRQPRAVDLGRKVEPAAQDNRKDLGRGPVAPRPEGLRRDAGARRSEIRAATHDGQSSEPAAPKMT
jgi:hypothetical protein